MSSPASQSTAALPFDLKGSVFTLSVMHLHRLDLEDIGLRLNEKIRQAPQFFRSMPVVLDLDSLTEEITASDFTALVAVLREKGLVPVGIRRGAEQAQKAAVDAGLAVLPDSPGRSGARTPREALPTEAQPAEAPAPAPALAPERAEPGTESAIRRSATRVVKQPVRSGQQIYAEGGDLIALKMVSAGAEILADGNIHILGPLRGRALAGAQGDDTAHIICQSLEAELISIAGRYRLFEEIDPSVRGHAVHIYLNADRLVIDRL
jgi:septum site-determining protein MinC